MSLIEKGEIGLHREAPKQETYASLSALSREVTNFLDTYGFEDADEVRTREGGEVTTKDPEGTMEATYTPEGNNGIVTVHFSGREWIARSHYLDQQSNLQMIPVSQLANFGFAPVQTGSALSAVAGLSRKLYGGEEFPADAPHISARERYAQGFFQKFSQYEITLDQLRQETYPSDTPDWMKRALTNNDPKSGLGKPYTVAHNRTMKLLAVWDGHGEPHLYKAFPIPNDLTEYGQEYGADLAQSGFTYITDAKPFTGLDARIIGDALHSLDAKKRNPPMPPAPTSPTPARRRLSRL